MREVRFDRLRSAFIGSVILACAGMSYAPAQADSDLEDLLAAGVERPAYLGHFAHASAAQIADLIALHGRTSAAPHVRLRALSALAESGHPDAQAFLRSLVLRANETAASSDALHPARSVPVLTRALHGLVSAPHGVAPEALTACLAHAHPAIRQAAVELLSAQHSKRAISLLEQQRAHERSPRVRRALSAALRTP